MSRAKQHPGFARPGQYTCRRVISGDPTDPKSRQCGQAVPAGELTHLALNSPTGHYLVLCLKCRGILDTLVGNWIPGASIGAARLISDYFKTTGGQLVSKAELRRVLTAAGDEVGRSGPLSDADAQKALGLMNRGPAPAN